VEPKQFHDTVGGYQRFDVFDVKVNRARRGPETAFEGRNEGGNFDFEGIFQEKETASDGKRSELDTK